nr:helix-turn-helix domain-containing protein [Mesorhizobium sp.]
MSSAANLERGLVLLEILAGAPEGLSLGEISELAGLPKSATHRVLSSLTACGFATQVKSRNYRLTMKMAALGFRTLGDSGGLEHCQVLLNKLAREFEELAGMTVVDSDRLVWIAKAQGARGSLVVDPGMGRDVALHATATGKVWLSSLPTDDAVTAVLRDGFGRLGSTDLTCCNPSKAYSGSCIRPNSEVMDSCGRKLSRALLQ